MPKAPTKAQYEVLERLARGASLYEVVGAYYLRGGRKWACLNNDVQDGVHPATVRALISLGLVEKRGMGVHLTDAGRIAIASVARR